MVVKRNFLVHGFFIFKFEILSFLSLSNDINSIVELSNNRENRRKLQKPKSSNFNGSLHKSLKLINRKKAKHKYKRNDHQVIHSCYKKSVQKRNAIIQTSEQK